MPPPPTLPPPPIINIPSALTSPDYIASVVDLPDNVSAAANGAKIIGEIVALPGASLIAEGRLGQGAIFAALGLLGGWAGGALLGPLGYVLLRYGASAVSYYESFATTATRPPAPTPTPTDGSQQTAQLVQAFARQQNEAITNLSNYVRDVTTRLADHQTQLGLSIAALHRPP